MNFFNRPMQPRQDTKAAAFNLNIEPMILNYSGKDVELMRKKMCEKFTIEMHKTTSFDYLINWIQAELNARFQSIEADPIFSKMPAISKLEPNIIAMATKLNYIDEYIEDIELNSEADWEAAKQVVSRLKSKTLEVKVRIDMELLMFVASGDQQQQQQQQQQSVAPNSRSEIPAVSPEDVVFPQFDTLTAPLGQRFSSSSLSASTSQQGPAQLTSLAQDALVGLSLSASASQQNAGFPPAGVSEPPAGVSESQASAAAAIQDLLQWVEQAPRVASTGTAQPQSESSSRPLEPSGASGALDASTDTRSDLVSMESLRSMNMADLAQMLVGPAQGTSVDPSTGLVDAALLRLESLKPVCSRCYLPFERREEHQLCERCSASASASRELLTGPRSSSGAVEREREPRGLCEHGAPSCCDMCVRKTLGPNESELHPDASASANAEEQQPPSLASASGAHRAADSGPDASLAASDSGSKKQQQQKPKVALRAKLANTSAKTVASLDAYIRREHKRLAYWSDKLNQCERILSTLPADSMIRREFEPLLWQKRSECELGHELLGLCRLQFDQQRLEHAALSRSSQAPSDELLAEAKRHQLRAEDLLRLPVILDGTHLAAPVGFQSEEQVRLVLRQVEALATSLRQLLLPAVVRVFPQIESRQEPSSESDTTGPTGSAPSSSQAEHEPEPEPEPEPAASLLSAPQTIGALERTLAQLELAPLSSLTNDSPHSLLQNRQLVMEPAADLVLHEERASLHEVVSATANEHRGALDGASSEAIDGQAGHDTLPHETAPLLASSLAIARDESSHDELQSKSSGEPESDDADDSDEEFELLKLDDPSLPNVAALETTQEASGNRAAVASAPVSTDESVARVNAREFSEPSTEAPESMLADATLIGSLNRGPTGPEVVSPPAPGSSSTIATSGAVELTATLISSTDSHACEELLCSTISGNRICALTAPAESEQANKSTVSAPALAVSESEANAAPLPMPRTIRCISPCEQLEPAATATAGSPSSSEEHAAAAASMNSLANESSKSAEQVKPLPEWAAAIRSATEPAASDAQQPRWLPAPTASPALSRLMGSSQAQPQPVLPLREVTAPVSQPATRESRIAALQLELIAMGFANREVNRRALEAANLDLNGALNWLVDNNDNNWSSSRH